MSLTGSAQGSTRADIIAHAKDAAAKYYGTECIGVELINEQAVTLTEAAINGGRETVVVGYEADWIADIKHSFWEDRQRIVCRHCGARPQ